MSRIYRIEIEKKGYVMGLNKIIFLDIDGVLRPGFGQDRFKHNLDDLKAEFISNRKT